MQLCAITWPGTTHATLEVASPPEFVSYTLDCASSSSLPDPYLQSSGTSCGGLWARCGRDGAGSLDCELRQLPPLWRMPRGAACPSACGLEPASLRLPVLALLAGFPVLALLAGLPVLELLAGFPMLALLDCCGGPLAGDPLNDCCCGPLAGGPVTGCCGPLAAGPVTGP